MRGRCQLVPTSSSKAFLSRKQFAVCVTREISQLARDPNPGTRSEGRREGIRVLSMN